MRLGQQEEKPPYDALEDLHKVNKHLRDTKKYHAQYDEQLAKLTPEVRESLTKAGFFKQFSKGEPWGFLEWHGKFDVKTLKLSPEGTTQAEELLQTAKLFATEHKGAIHHLSKIKICSGIGDGAKEKLFHEWWQNYNHFFEKLEASGVSPDKVEKLKSELSPVLVKDIEHIACYLFPPKQLDKERIGLLRLMDTAESSGLKGGALAKAVLERSTTLEAETIANMGKFERFIKSAEEVDGRGAMRKGAKGEELLQEAKTGKAVPWIIGGAIVAGVLGCVAMLGDKKQQRSENWATRVREQSSADQRII